ncbi:DUF1444 family protein [Acidilutibacter cellobiosedens]|uniref:DUF1444 family protein n=1 Tax=Acidilutibacter cellobiosedens TaxID=2507161 RepID=A0A410QG68_9FIRM|nr:DUF1444 family protein [Acidilutibacter cellobiosedens]QAT62838.1 DUF1444 family protein [Acidilutibacter cellobiosedens]
MEYMEFANRMIQDLKREFNEVRLDEKERLYIGSEFTNASLPLRTMYQEHQIVGYQKNLQNYIKIISDVLNCYRFKLNLSNVFPFVKPKEFGEDINHNFIREDLFCNLSLFYVVDMGEVFRFVLYDDLKNANIDLKILKNESMKNLNKMTNFLGRLDDALHIYTLYFNSDFGATLFLTEHIQQQIRKKVGTDILFCMPSSSCFICAKHNEHTIDTQLYILRQLIEIEKDINKISKNIYRKDSQGNYSIIA